MAQAGGKNPAGIPDAIAAAKECTGGTDQIIIRIVGVLKYGTIRMASVAPDIIKKYAKSLKKLLTYLQKYDYNLSSSAVRILPNQLNMHNTQLEGG